jgi:hypothetical protein
MSQGTAGREPFGAPADRAHGNGENATGRRIGASRGPRESAAGIQRSV